MSSAKRQNIALKMSLLLLRSLVNYEENSYSPIQPDQEPDSGPVDPVFVDEESSGEAVANAGKHNNK